MIPEFIEMVTTQFLIDILMKLAPLYSAHIELCIYAKNSTLMKISQWSLFLEQVTILTLGH